MAQSRAQQVKQLVPGLNAIFGSEYGRYVDEYAVLFETEGSNRAFEEEVLFPGLDPAVVKPEGSPVTYASTEEGWVARYNHETIALAFSITEEAFEDNLYEKLSARLSRALARSMQHTKEVKGANVYNRAFDSSYPGGDGQPLCSDNHPLQNGKTLSNNLNPAADLSETSLEAMLINISTLTDDRDINIALMGMSLHIPPQLIFIAERILKSEYRPATADNDINAMVNMGMFPKGYHVNHRFTDPKAFFIRTDAPNCMKHFDRVSVSNNMEGDFETGNVRYKARERYSFGWSDWRGVYGSAGSS